MKIKEIKPHVFHVTYETQEELAKAFLPFQEFYENIHFARKFFTLEDFKKWYAAKFGAFSYYEDWSGFNVPGWLFNEAKGPPEDLARLSRESSKLYDIFSAMTHFGDGIYVIGTTEDTDPATLDHELAHARYSLDDSYADTVLELLTKYAMETKDLEDHLKAISYHPNVICDEVHAYVLTEEEYLTEKGLWTPGLAKLREEIKEKIW